MKPLDTARTSNYLDEYVGKLRDTGLALSLQNCDNLVPFKTV